MVVIKGMIAVIGGGHEDWVEVDGGDAQVLQVVELFDHTLQVTALEAEAGGGRFPWLNVGGLFNRLRFGKAVGKDLVKNGVLDPVRGVCQFGHRVFSSSKVEQVRMILPLK